MAVYVRGECGKCRRTGGRLDVLGLCVECGRVPDSESELAGVTNWAAAMFCVLVFGPLGGLVAYLLCEGMSRSVLLADWFALEVWWVGVVNEFFAALFRRMP